MKKLYSLIIICTLACFASIAATEAPISPSPGLKSTEFGTEDGYAPGSLDGQRGWTTLGQPATIVSSSLIPGKQALQLAQGGDSWAVHGLRSGSMQAVQIGIDMELHASTLASQGTRLRIGGMEISFFLAEAGAFVCMEYPDATDWDITIFPTIVPADSEGALGMSHLNILLDAHSGVWSLAINGITIAEHLPLAADESRDLPLMMSAGESGPARVTSISIEEVPSFDETIKKNGLGDNATKDGAGAVPAAPQAKQVSQTVVAAVSSPGDSGDQGGPMKTMGGGMQPAFFTIFSPN